MPANLNNFTLKKHGFGRAFFCQKVAFLLEKWLFLCYNTSCRGTHGPIRVSTKIKKHNSHLFEAKCQSHGINHAQSISCYAFLFLS